MITVRELEKHFDGMLDRRLSCEWDNDGLMLCVDSQKEVKKALLALDITEETLMRAIELNVDAIFTHHPFIFKPIRSLCDTDGRGRLIFELINHNISVFSYHTRLDAAEGGVNDILSTLVGLKNVRKLGDGDLALGRIGDIEPCTAKEFAQNAKNVLCASSVCLATSNTAPKLISKAAVLGGSCDRELVYAAIEQGAEVILTGDASYNLVLDANIDGINVVCAGHYASENPVLSFFEIELSKLGVETVRFDCGYFEYI